MANGTNVGNAYLQIVPTSQGIQGSITGLLNKQAGDAGTTAGGVMGKFLGSGLGKAVAALGIGTMVAGIVKSSLEEGGKLQQSLGGVEAIFGDSADKVKAYASEAWKSVGVSANEYMEGVTGFSAALINSMGGDTARAAEVANQAFIDMGDNANRFGTDMSAIQNAYQGFAKQNYTMLDNLKLGYGGTKTEMERLLADATKLSGVEYDISNLGDVYEAIHVIQEELNVTGTTANEAATTLQGASAAMKAAWADLLGNMAIGESIQQPLANLGEAASAFIFNNLIPMVLNAVSSLPGAIIQIAASAITQLVTNLPSLLQQLWGALKGAASGIGEAIRTAIPQVLKAFKDMFSTAIKTAKNTDWKGLAQDAIKKIKDTWSRLKEELPKKIKEIVNTAIEWAKGVDWIGLGKTAIEFIGKGISFLVTNIPKAIKDIATTAIEWAKGVDWLGLGKSIITFIVDGITALVTNIPQALKSIGSTAIEWVKGVDWIGLGKTVITTIVSGITSLVTSIPNALKSIGSTAINTVKNVDWKSAGTSAINGIKNGIIGIGSTITSALKGVLNDAKDGASKLANSTEWNLLGKYMVTGIQVGIKANTPSVVKAMDDTVKAAMKSGKQTAVVQSPSKLFRDELGKYLALGVAEGITDYAPAVERATDELINGALGSHDMSMALHANSGALSSAYNSGAMANTYIIDVHAKMDGTEIKTEVADYTIRKVGNDQLTLMRAQGY